MSTATKERPIIFSAPMVRALLEGRKTQMRRIITDLPNRDDLKPARVDDNGVLFVEMAGVRGHKANWPFSAAHRLWVRETWKFYGRYRNDQPEGGVMYRADLASKTFEAFSDPMAVWKEFDLAAITGTWNRWRSAMPRWACRLTLEISDVRVERVQGISEADAEAEGPIRLNCGELGFEQWTSAFRNVWIDINGHGSWEKNPWVWALTFKVLTPEAPHAPNL